MNNPSPAQRRNPWPIAIVVYFILFISFIVTFIVFATRQHVDLVRDDYYEEEIRFQRQLDRVQRTRDLDGRAAVTYNATQRCIIIKLPAAQPSQTTGQIHLYRPSDAKLDQAVQLALDTNGAQRVDATHLRDGLWKVRVQWFVDGQDYYVDQPVVVRGPTVL
jgi:hypothetical protein